MKAMLWLFAGLVGVSAVAGGFDSSSTTIQAQPTYVQTETRTLPSKSSVVDEEIPKNTEIERSVRVVPDIDIEVEVTPDDDVDFYTNVDGDRVQSPTYYPSAPAGASAECRDGTYSFSRNRRGTCSGHGGVAQWL